MATSRCAVAATSAVTPYRFVAITELARIARSEVLIHPISARDGRYLDDFTDTVDRGLTSAGLHTQTFIAPSTWLRGASTMRIST